MSDEPTRRVSRRRAPVDPVADPVAVDPAVAGEPVVPAYYADLVSDAQRQQIYAIQEAHEKKIAALREQLDVAEKARDTEIEAVLDAQQKAKLATARAEAAAPDTPGTWSDAGRRRGTGVTAFTSAPVAAAVHSAVERRARGHSSAHAWPGNTRAARSTSAPAADSGAGAGARHRQDRAAGRGTIQGRVGQYCRGG